MPSLSALVQRRELKRAGIRPARKSSVRLTLTWLIVVAFTWQSFLAQTHIHISYSLGTAPILDLARVNASVSDNPSTNEPSGVPRDKYPVNGDPANCPICQEIMHTGQLVVPAAALLVLPSAVAFGFPVFIETATHFRAPSHIWQGRAPPIL